MAEYDFTVEHRPGVRHTNADALSRHPCSVKSCVCKGHQLAIEYMLKVVSTAKESSEVTNDMNSTAEFWSMDGLCTAQKNDPDIAFMLNLMEKSTEKHLSSTEGCPVVILHVSGLMHLFRLEPTGRLDQLTWTCS